MAVTPEKLESTGNEIVVTGRPIQRRGFSIEEFRTEMTKNGTMRSNHGHVIFPMTPALMDRFDNHRAILLRVDEMSLPSVWMTTDDSIRRYGYGPVEHVPIHPQFDTYNISVIADKNGFVHQYFSAWMNSIVNFDTSKGIMGGDSGARPYEASYRNEYAVDIAVKAYDTTTDDILEYKMMAAYPRAMNESRISWRDRDDIIRLQVQFEYRDWALMSAGSNSMFNSFFDKMVGGLSGVKDLSKGLLDFL